MNSSLSLLCLLGLAMITVATTTDQFEDSEEHFRLRRQANQNAMDRAMTNNPVGQPEFRGHYYGGQFQDKNNFGAAVGGSVGVKVFEKGAHSVGLGAGVDSSLGMRAGKPFMTRPDVGVGVGYKFRFKRSPLDVAVAVDDVMDDAEVDDKENHYNEQDDDEAEEYTSVRVRRQANQNAMNRAMTNKPVGKPDFDGHYYGGRFQDSKNFGARVGGSVGMKVYQNGRHSFGVGAGVDANVGRMGGKPFVTRPDFGIGAGYRYRF